MTRVVLPMVRTEHHNPEPSLETLFQAPETIIQKGSLELVDVRLLISQLRASVGQTTCLRE